MQQELVRADHLVRQAFSAVHDRCRDRRARGAVVELRDVVEEPAEIGLPSEQLLVQLDHEGRVGATGLAGEELVSGKHGYPDVVERPAHPGEEHVVVVLRRVGRAVEIALEDRRDLSAAGRDP